MTHTFDIRFARSVGWSALIEEPANSFRWKGGGLLSIDADGVSIAGKRGLLTLRAQSRHIAADHLTNVYREADALRLEFSTPDAPHTVLPFWASNRNVAAEIVSLLPTQHTVELEHSTAGSTPRVRYDWRLVAWPVTGLIVVCFALALPRYLAPSAVQSSAAALSTQTARPALPAGREILKTTGVPSVATPVPDKDLPVAIPTHDSPALVQDAVAGPVPVRRNPVERFAPATDTVGQTPALLPTGPLAAGSNAHVSPLGWSVRALVSRGVSPIVPGMPAYDAARRQLDTFEGECATLRAGYLEIRDSPTADSLMALDERWWKVTLRIYHSEEMQDPALRGLREIELAVARSWHSFLASYAAGLRSGDEALIAASLAELKFAESLEVRARRYVL